MDTNFRNAYMDLLKEYNALEDKWIMPDEKDDAMRTEESRSFALQMIDKMDHQIVDCPTEETLRAVEQILGLQLSPQMEMFLLRYGSVSIGSFETIDLIANDAEHSPMVEYTRRFRSINMRFPEFIVFHVPNEYDWFFCNDKDTVFHCSFYTGKMESLHMDLLSYIADEGRKAQRRMKRRMSNG